MGLGTAKRQTGPVTSLEEIWPPLGVRLTAGPLRLHGLRDVDIPELVELAGRGIHEPDRMPFSTPWTDAPAAELPGKMAAHYWQTRAEFSPSRWVLDLVVRHEGVVVGLQGFDTHDYLITRTGETGSWLGRAHHGQGIGTRMRQAICALLFDHLDAQEITSAAFTDNPASLAVSRKVGYRANGVSRERRRDQLASSQRLVLTPETFRRGDALTEVDGVAALRRFIGLP
jgi:RimJ/RimL family protein N-acetyltransferase